MNKLKFLDYLKMSALIAIVFVSCFFFFDKFVVWKYHLQTANAPCQTAESLCKEQYPRLTECFESKLTNRSIIYINGQKYESEPVDLYYDLDNPNQTYWKPEGNYSVMPLIVK